MNRLTVIAIATAIGVASPTTVAAATETSGMAVSAAAATPDQIRDVLAYWTPGRMAAAEPAPMRAVAPSRGARRETTGKPETFGPLSSRITSTASLTRTRPGPQPAPLAGGFEWDGFYAAPIAQRTGKLFFTLPSGSNAYCSASVVAGENRDLVWTAGHCVYDRGAFVTNVVFVPFYRDGQAPYGMWTARQLRVTPDYRQYETVFEDLGAVVLNTGGIYGLHVADTVGALAIAFFQPVELFSYDFGYPARPFHFTGERLIYCLGFLANRLPGLDPPILRAECDMREGASGGPWTVYFNGFFGTVISVSSHYLLTDPPGYYLYGSYHGQPARDLFEQARYA